MDVPSEANPAGISDARQLKISPKALRAIVNDLVAENRHGRPVPYGDRVVALRELAESGLVHTLEPLLPLMLNLNGKPYTLQGHQPFGEMFRAMMPKQQIWCTARQVSKSTSAAASGVILSNSIPNFKTLYVTPLYEQIRRFSNNFVRPFINESPVKSLWCGTSTENSVLQRSFKNLALMIFSFALLDADRVRGVSAHMCHLDEVQDMDPDHIPIIQETMSASEWELSRYTGTPKTNDNAVAKLWARSSQAEWFVPCLSCNTWNIPSLEHNLLEMIGDWTPHISPQYPGTVCHKCRKPISPAHGRWVHKYPSKRWSFAGFHVPQIIVPLHYASPDKWSTLLHKRETMPEPTFLNEVLGESCDAGQKLVTETELRAACILDWVNQPKQPLKIVKTQLSQYKQRVMAVDWGGGGEEGVSFTVITVMGFRNDGKIDVLWGRRLLTGADHLREAVEIIKWCRAFEVDFIAHDYTGAGTVRETVLVQAGFDIDRIMAFRLGRSASQDLMVYKPPTNMNHRQHYSLDKTRSLLYTCQAIKLKLIRFFKYDYENEDSPGLITDFLALVENKTETRLAGDIYTITRNMSMTDDFAQAVNLGGAALWHINDAWPNFAEIAGLGHITPRTLEAAGNREYGWDEDMSDQFFNIP